MPTLMKTALEALYTGLTSLRMYRSMRMIMMVMVMVMMVGDDGDGDDEDLS